MKFVMPSANSGRYEETQIPTDHEIVQTQGPVDSRPHKNIHGLKAQLISEPVLSAPVYDGSPFILTTYGSKDAFASVLSQRIKTTLPGGKEVKRLHPIAFAS